MSLPPREFPGGTRDRADVDDGVRTIPGQIAVCDLHCDTVWKWLNHGDDPASVRNHVDIAKLHRGGVGLQVFACCLDQPKPESGYFPEAVRMLEFLVARLGKHSDRIGIARNRAEVERLSQEGKIAAVLAVEGGHALEGKLKHLRTFRDRGVRLVTLTWNFDNDLGGASASSAQQGLAPFGREVVREMDRLGLIIDVSHASEKTFWDVMETSAAPVIASHSCVYQLRQHHRNLKDEQITALAEGGGMIGINFYPEHLGPQRQPASVLSVVDQIDHVVRIGGIECIGIGSDFDGIPTTPVGLRNSSQMPNLTCELLRRGYREHQIKRILGGNFLRVFRQICGEGKIAPPDQDPSRGKPLPHGERKP